jgi:hypothetical protein
VDEFMPQMTDMEYELFMDREAAREDEGEQYVSETEEIFGSEDAFWYWKQGGW